MLKNGSGFRRLTRSLIRSTECELQVGANGLAVLFQQNGSFFGAICGNQSASIENVRIADQKRLGKTIESPLIRDTHVLYACPFLTANRFKEEIGRAHV